MFDIDEIVERVTERVAERLGGSGSTCFASEVSCTSCGQCVIKKPTTVGRIIDLGAARISCSPGVTAEKFDSRMAKMIDHTLLKPEATREDLLRLTEEAKKYSFASVCVNAANIPFVVRQLKGSDVMAVAVVGFPLGATTSAAKAYEAREAIQAGAREIDMVINIGALKSKDYKLVYEDIKRVVEVSAPAKTKVIIEAGALDHEQKIAACVLAKAAGAAFVKTSTGFGPGGATVEDVALMRKVVGEEMEIKASGGIRTREDAEAMVKAGANRIGASASVAIVTGAAQKKEGRY